MSLLVSLGLGVALIAIANLALFRYSSLSARQAAVMTALATLGIYVPLAVLYWPGVDVFAIHLAIYLVTSVAFGLILASRGRVGGDGQKSFHWGPAAIIGFFVFIVMADGIFVVMAERGLPPQLLEKLLPARNSGNVSSVFPGMVSHDFQKNEDLYKEYLRQVERQEERGWQVRKGWLKKPILNEPAVFQVMATTREGEPLRQAEITGQFLRPSNSRLDREFAMAEVEPGLYQANLRLPAAGKWRLVMQLRKGGDLHEIRASTSVLAR